MIMGGLQKINCDNNFKIEKDGKCHSTECMLSQHEEIKKIIKKNGCTCFKQE